MKYDQVLIRFGDLMLKGKNKHTFVQKVTHLIRLNIKDLNVEMIKTHDRVYLKLNEIDPSVIKERLMRVSGVASFSFVKVTSWEIEDIVKTSIDLINHEIKEGSTFKIESKRADKRFPITSLELSKLVAPQILSKMIPKVKIDVRKPEETLHIEVREEATYIYLKSIKGLGGFPVGVGGKASLLLSGGIDSPVSAFLAMKQGIYLEGIHFESTPMTSIESVQKVIDIAKKLAIYTPKHQFSILMVPFKEMHQAILKYVPDAYTITIMRRMMFRIAEQISLNRGSLALVTGESVGQVASQTLESMQVIEDVTKLPILRPLLTYDKQEIITISNQIDTFNISIKPFEDCCSIYVPKAPTTKPSIKKSVHYESFIPNYEEIIEKTANNTKEWVIHANDKLDITMLGFTMLEAWDVINND